MESTSLIVSATLEEMLGDFSFPFVVEEEQRQSQTWLAILD